jgi:riboflavin kinase/FMN adenylyltransferase
MLLPPNGVYAAHVRVGPKVFRSVLNIGIRPTIKNPTPTPRVEVHLLDFSSDLYGQELEITFSEKLREELKFASVEALREQIARDLVAARISFET